MAGRIESTPAAADAGLWRGIVGIVLTGIALGVAHNGLERAGKSGVDWIGREVALAELEEPENPGATGGYESEMTDPLGISSAGRSVLDKIPPGEPRQVQLSAVKRFFDEGAVLIIDARERYEYEAGHIAGAINLPYEETVTDVERLESLQTNGKALVVYCGGGTCELSINLGYALSEAGHPKVLVFMGGFPEWEAAGYPVESGAGVGAP